jgi:hypothetical protein
MEKGVIKSIITAKQREILSVKLVFAWKNQENLH